MLVSYAQSVVHCSQWKNCGTLESRNCHISKLTLWQCDEFITDLPDTSRGLQLLRRATSQTQSSPAASSTLYITNNWIVYLGRPSCYTQVLPHKHKLWAQLSYDASLIFLVSPCSVLCSGSDLFWKFLGNPHKKSVHNLFGNLVHRWADKATNFSAELVKSPEFYYKLALITRPPDRVLHRYSAPQLASLRELLPVVQTECRNRSLGVASAVVRT